MTNAPTPAPKRGDIRTINGNQCRLIERELEGDKWEVIGPAPTPAGMAEDRPTLRDAAQAVIDWCDLVAKHPADFAPKRADANLRGPAFDELREALAALAPVAAEGGALADIAAERRRQIDSEGYSAARDDLYVVGELGLAAALYALPYDATLFGDKVLKQDDFIALDILLTVGLGWTLKPEPNPRHRLVKAGALIVAEIDRLDRAALRTEPTGGGEGA